MSELASKDSLNEEASIKASSVNLNKKPYNAASI